MNLLTIGKEICLLALIGIGISVLIITILAFTPIPSKLMDWIEKR